MAELALLAGRNPGAAGPALAAAVDAGLLSESGDRLAFRHDLVRDAIYHDLPVAVRKGLHREAGAVLGGAGVPVERVASHLAGAEHGDAEAVAWLRQAARRGAAPATTVRLLERALEITDPGDPICDALAAELVEPLLSSGRPREAEAVARNVLARASKPEVEVAARTGLASVLAMGVRYPEGIHQLEQATLSAPERERHSPLPRSLLMVLDGQLGPLCAEADRAVETGERLGNDHVLCLGLQTLAIVALAEGFIDRAVTMAERAVTVAERSDGPGPITSSLTCGSARPSLTAIASTRPRWCCRRAGRQAEQAGDVARLPLYHWAIAEVRLAGGHWDDALAEAQAGLGLIEDNGHQSATCSPTPSAPTSPSTAAICILARSAVHEAHRSLVAGPLEIGFEWMSWIDALLLETQGRPGHELWPSSRRLGSRSPQSVTSRPRPERWAPTWCGWLAAGSPARRCRSPRNSSAALDEPHPDRPRSGPALPRAAHRRPRCPPRSRRRPPERPSSLPVGRSL